MNESGIEKSYESLINEVLVDYAGTVGRNDDGKCDYNEDMLEEVVESFNETPYARAIIYGHYAFIKDNFSIENANRKFLEDVKDAGNTIGIFNSNTKLTFEDVILYLKCYAEELFETKKDATKEEEKQEIFTKMVVVDDITNDLTMRNGKYAFSKIKEYKEKLDD